MQIIPYHYFCIICVLELRNSTQKIFVIFKHKLLHFYFADLTNKTTHRIHTKTFYLLTFEDLQSLLNLRKLIFLYNCNADLYAKLLEESPGVCIIVVLEAPPRDLQQLVVNHSKTDIRWKKN